MQKLLQNNVGVVRLDARSKICKKSLHSRDVVRRANCIPSEHRHLIYIDYLLTQPACLC